MPNRPDFIVIGGQFDGKVWLLASRKLRSTEIHEQYETEDIYSDGRFGVTPGFHRTILRDRYIDIKTRVSDYMQVIAASYPEAWASLFEMWSPSGGDPELPGQRALGR